MGARNRFITMGLIAMLLLMLAACSAGPAAVPEDTVQSGGVATQTTVQPGALPVETTVRPETVPVEPVARPGTAMVEPTSPSVARAKTVAGIIQVGDGSQLERDIIPQLTRLFALTSAEVKAALAAVRPSRLIAEPLKGFRRMEGVIPPGQYEIPAGSRIDSQVEAWIRLAEARYDTLVRDIRATGSTNSLKPYQHLILASMVEAECLADAHEREVATVFLNRLDQKGMLQSCVTVEYAVGYQRPYLLKSDIQVSSPYNTYQKAGLPVGPIASPDDASLRAAMSRKLDSAIHYFYYDYLKNDLFCFVNYRDFSASAVRSKEQFVARSPVGRWDKINKQTLYGRD